MKQRPFGKGTRRSYSLLAAFITLAIMVSAYLTSQLAISERESLTTNEQAAMRLMRVAALDRAGGDVDEPANDVFADGDVAAVRAKLEAAVNAFRKQIESTRMDVRDDIQAVVRVNRVNDA